MEYLSNMYKMDPETNSLELDFKQLKSINSLVIFLAKFKNLKKVQDF